MDNKNYLILGGTGAMGAYLTTILAKLGGGNIYCTSRSSHVDKGNIFYLQGNAREPKFLNEVLGMKHWDAIIDFMAYSTKDFEQVYEQFLSHTEQYVFLSSSRVYAESEGPITEDSPRLLDVCKDADYLATDEYALAKAREENILRASGKKNWTIIRPYITFGDYRLQLSCEEKESWLYRCLQGKTIVFSKDLADKQTSFTYGEDVSRGIAAIVGKQEALGEAFHITNSEHHKWGEICNCYLSAIEKETGRKPKLLLTDKYEYYYGGNVPQVKYDRLYNREFDNSKINQFVDIKTFHPTHEALDCCIHNFIQNPRWLPINWMYEAYKDRLTGDKDSLGVLFSHLKDIPGKRSKFKYLLVGTGLMNPPR